MEQRDSFVFYRSFFEAIQALRPEERADAYAAICDYALNGAVPRIAGGSAAVFLLSRPILDSNQRRYENGRQGGKARAALGTKPEPGPNQDGTKPEPKPNQDRTEPQPYVSVSVSVNEEKEPPPKGGVKKKRFVPPTLAEVASYVASRHSPVEPQVFLDFYESKGWMVGKTPMKDWKAACRNAECWERWTRKGSAAHELQEL